MFQSPETWIDFIGNNERIESVNTWEMDSFDIAWKEWLNTENEYELGDKKYFESHIKPYTCFSYLY